MYCLLNPLLSCRSLIELIGVTIVVSIGRTTFKLVGTQATSRGLNEQAKCSRYDQPQLAFNDCAARTQGHLTQVFRRRHSVFPQRFREHRT